MRDFNGKSVVVTGAGSGIGQQIALAFAKRGARLSVADINADRLEATRKEIEAMGNTVKSWVVDVSKAEQVKDFCDAVYNEMGRVDVLCNNAGVAVGGFLEDIPLEDWEWIFGVNLWGIIHGLHYFYPRMIKQGGGGHICNTASGAGLVPMPVLVPYCTTKYGVVGLCEAFRPEAALHRIGVSAICPGTVTTNITKDSRIDSGTTKYTPSQVLEKVNQLYVKRNYQPDRVAAAVVKAVEKNKGVVPVCPETYVQDWAHRISRKMVDINLKYLMKALSRFL
jgi:NAD(P)-dependent dehydrogenase (short-subunit alcohol dehydrogenase family)